MRLDSHTYNGDTVPPHYESMIGQVVTDGSSREPAIARMNGALTEIATEGIKTNNHLQKSIINNTNFTIRDTNIH